MIITLKGSILNYIWAKHQNQNYETEMSLPIGKNMKLTEEFCVALAEIFHTNIIIWSYNNSGSIIKKFRTSNECGEIMAPINLLKMRGNIYILYKKEQALEINARIEISEEGYEEYKILGAEKSELINRITELKENKGEIEKVTSIIIEQLISLQELLIPEERTSHARQQSSIADTLTCIRTRLNSIHQPICMHQDLRTLIETSQSNAELLNSREGLSEVDGMVSYIGGGMEGSLESGGRPSRLITNPLYDDMYVAPTTLTDLLPPLQELILLDTHASIGSSDIQAAQSILKQINNGIIDPDEQKLMNTVAPQRRPLSPLPQDPQPPTVPMHNRDLGKKPPVNCFCLRCRLFIPIRNIKQCELCTKSLCLHCLRYIYTIYSFRACNGKCPFTHN